MTYRSYCTLLLLGTCFLCSYGGYAQDVEWANKILQTSHIDKEYENNHLGMILGPPAVYPDSDYEKETFDMYAEGYIIHQNGNKKEQVDVGFNKSMIATQLCIAGIFNAGVIKKAYILLKDNKEKQVYSSEKSTDTKKFHSIFLNFTSETVYGVRIVIDHSKVRNWNIIKGIGIYKGGDSLKIQPNLVEEYEKISDRKKLGREVNSNCAEFNPKLSMDGSTLFFCRDCPNGKDAEEIFISPALNSQDWDKGVNVGKPLNNKGHNYVISTTLDPTVLYVGNVYKQNGEEAGVGLSKATKKEDGTWTLPEPVSIPPTPGKEYINYFVNMEQTVMFIVAEDLENTSNLDLYVSTYNKYKKEWDAPVALGAEVNTEFVEDFPYLSSDGNSLYFCSNGRLGYGGYDIYVSKKADNSSWTKWSKPQNLGPNVNSETDDFAFVVSNAGDLAYLTSVSMDSQDHNVDIYRVTLPPSLQQPALTALKGRITNERTTAPVNATVKYHEVGKRNAQLITVATDSDGNFSYVLPHGKEYEVEIEAANFFKIKEVLSLTDASTKGRFQKNYTMQPFLDSGQVSVMRSILFEFGTAKIKETSFPELDNLVKQLTEQSKSVVEIAGHTDDVGNDTFNLRLSRWRAGAVIDYLVAKGVRPWRLKLNGYGETAPIAPNDTEEGRSLNRRVEMTILEDDFTKKHSKKNTGTVKGKPQKATKKDDEG